VFVILTAPSNVHQDEVSVLIKHMNVFAYQEKKLMWKWNPPLLVLMMEAATKISFSLWNMDESDS